MMMLSLVSLLMTFADPMAPWTETYWPIWFLDTGAAPPLDEACCQLLMMGVGA